MSTEKTDIKEGAKKRFTTFNILFIVLLVLLIGVNIGLIIYVVKLVSSRIGEISSFFRSLGIQLSFNIFNNIE
ncbi:MAG TPA: hypothetical protein GX505_02905 [Clostridiales bacterium]|nr:hypothetical protein [Clostridiales bacterium]